METTSEIVQKEFSCEGFCDYQSRWAFVATWHNVSHYTSSSSSSRVRNYVCNINFTIMFKLGKWRTTLLACLNSRNRQPQFVCTYSPCFVNIFSSVSYNLHGQTPNQLNFKDFDNIAYSLSQKVGHFSFTTILANWPA